MLVGILIAVSRIRYLSFDALLNRVLAMGISGPVTTSTASMARSCRAISLIASGVTITPPLYVSGLCGLLGFTCWSWAGSVRWLSNFRGTLALWATMRSFSRLGLALGCGVRSGSIRTFGSVCIDAGLRCLIFPATLASRVPAGLCNTSILCLLPRSPVDLSCSLAICRAIAVQVRDVVGTRELMLFRLGGAV